MDEQNTLFGAFDDIMQDDAQEHPESDTGHPEEQDELVQIGLYIASLLEEISGDLSCIAGEGRPVPASRTGGNFEARDGNLLRPTPPPVPSTSSGWSSRSPVRGATPHNNEPSVIREATPPVSLPANSESPTAIPANVAPAPVPAMPARPEDEDTPAHVESETASERQLERVEAESDVQRQEQQDNSLLGQLKRNLAQWDGQPVNDDANLTEAAGMAVDGPLFAAVKDIARLVETDKNDTSLLGVLKKTVADKTGITAAQDWAEAQRASMIEGIRVWANGGTPESTGDSSPEASTYSQRDEQGRFIRRDAPAPAPVASEPPSQTLSAPAPAEPPSPASASVLEPTPVPTASESPSQTLPAPVPAEPPSPASASVLEPTPVPTASESPSQTLPTPAAQDDANPVFSLQRNDSKRKKKRHAEVVRHLRNITDILESFPTASGTGTTVDESQGNASAVAVTNTSKGAVTLLREREFQSDNAVSYTLENTIIVQTGETINAPVTQRSKTEVETSITKAMPFYEILISRAMTPTVMAYTVLVDESGRGDKYVKWEFNRRFFNAYAESRVYDEFFHTTDQLGIRFGNGTFGKIPPEGALVRIELQITQGNTTLLAGQSLYPLEEVTTEYGLPVSVDIFARAWGEEESEKMWGYNVEHINKIFITAYAPRKGVREDVMQAIADVPMLCRNFKWHDPEHVLFSLRIKGCTLTDRVLSEVVQDVKSALTAAYGKDSLTRRDDVRIHELYECIYATGHFEKTSGAWFELGIRGRHTAERIYQMVSIDLEASEIDIQYMK